MKLVMNLLRYIGIIIYYLPLEHISNSILLAWNPSLVQVSNTVADSHCVTRFVSPLKGEAWWLTVVYGLQSIPDKINFLAALSARWDLCPGPWLLIGDFNLILQDANKHNSHIHRR